jgi:hypothetical protein
VAAPPALSSVEAAFAAGLLLLALGLALMVAAVLVTGLFLTGVYVTALGLTVTASAAALRTLLPPRP